MERRFVRGKCHECGGAQKFDIGSLGLDAALEKLQALKTFECKGEGYTPHQCFGDAFGQYQWEYEDGKIRIFVEEIEEPPTDEAWLAKQAAEGRKMMLTCDLPPECEHLGFGEFRNATHDYLRTSSPRGTRFYQEVRR